MVKANLGYIESPKPTVGSMAKPGLKNKIIWSPGTQCVWVCTWVCVCVSWGRTEEDVWCPALLLSTLVP